MRSILLLWEDEDSRKENYKWELSFGGSCSCGLGYGGDWPVEQVEGTRTLTGLSC